MALKGRQAERGADCQFYVVVNLLIRHAHGTRQGVQLNCLLLLLHLGPFDLSVF